VDIVCIMAMNRSFRAPEKEMPVTATVKQRQQQMLGSFRKSVMKEKEDELGLFLEMRKREKELLLQNTEDDEFDSSIGKFDLLINMFQFISCLFCLFIKVYNLLCMLSVS